MLTVSSHKEIACLQKNSTLQLLMSAVVTVTVFREGQQWRISFAPYNAEVRAKIAQIPHCSLDSATKSWIAPITAQSVETLRSLRWEYGCTPDPDTLLLPGERPPRAKPATLREGSKSSTFAVHMAARNDLVYRQLNTIPGGRWVKEIRGFVFPSTSALHLEQLVSAGVIDDPDAVLSYDGEVKLFYDSYTGNFLVKGDDRAQESFDRSFPEKDVMRIWDDRSLGVEFGDDLTKETYNGELARIGPGLQPEGMTVDLYPFQRQDCAFIVAKTGAALFSSMGVGKTAVAIAAAHERLNNRKTVPRAVIIVPPALRTQWKNEIIRFTQTSPDNIVVIDGNPKKRADQYEAAKSAQWLVVHYNAIILKDAKKALPELCLGAFLVADEVHRIKDHTTATAKQIKKIASRASCRLGLSGTPVENKPGEWYNVFSGFVYPGIFGSVFNFLETYSYPGEFGGYTGARNLPQLAKRSRFLYVRHRLEEVAEHLPPMRVETMVLDPTPAYKAALDGLHASAKEEIAAGRISKAEERFGELDAEQTEEAKAGSELTATSMLKMACCSPLLIHQSDSESAKALVEAGVVPDEDGPKIEKLREIAKVAALNNDRIVVFCFSKKMVNVIADRLTTDGVRYVTYTGDTNRAQRDEAVEAFTSPSTQTDPGPTIFLATDAAAEGLNLGACCSTLVNLDIPWTPGRLGQRNGRIRRLDSKVTGFLIINMIISGTIESNFLTLVETKADLADAIMNENTGRSTTTGRAGRNKFREVFEDWSKKTSGFN